MFKYLAIARTSLSEGLNFRARIPIITAEYLIMISVNYFIWKTVGSSSDQVAGFDLSQLVTYAVIVWIMRSFVMNSIDSRLNTLYRGGTIVYDMVKPVNLFAYYSSIAVGKSAFMFFFNAIPVLIIVYFVIPLRFPTNISTLLLFCVSICLSFTIFAIMNYIIGMMVFFLESIQGLTMFKAVVIDLATGLLIPLSFYPKGVQVVLNLLPFRYTLYSSLEIFLEKINQFQSIRIIFLQLGWVLLLYGISTIVTSKARKNVSIQGG